MGSLVSEMCHSEVTATLELFSRIGISHKDMTKLRSSTSGLSLDVLQGIANLIRYGDDALRHGPYTEHIVDGNAPPVNPEGWKEWSVVKHEECGKVRVHPDHIVATTTPSQAEMRSLGINSLNMLETELKKVKVLNANVLWYLYARPWLIPAHWREYNVFFWGTHFRGPRNTAGCCNGNPCVFGLEWNDNLPAAPHNWQVLVRRTENVLGKRDMFAIRTPIKK